MEAPPKTALTNTAPFIALVGGRGAEGGAGGLVAAGAGGGKKCVTGFE